jgi:hypothetical protein
MKRSIILFSVLFLFVGASVLAQGPPNFFQTGSIDLLGNPDIDAEDIPGLNSNSAPERPDSFVQILRPEDARIVPGLMLGRAHPTVLFGLDKQTTQVRAEAILVSFMFCDGNFPSPAFNQFVGRVIVGVGAVPRSQLQLGTSVTLSDIKFQRASIAVTSGKVAYSAPVGYNNRGDESIFFYEPNDGIDCPFYYVLIQRPFRKFTRLQTNGDYFVITVGVENYNWAFNVPPKLHSVNPQAMGYELQSDAGEDVVFATPIQEGFVLKRYDTRNTTNADSFFPTVFISEKRQTISMSVLYKGSRAGDSFTADHTQANSTEIPALLPESQADRFWDFVKTKIPGAQPNQD